MRPALLDVNLLIALFWPAHAQHGPPLRWFQRYGRRGWATCPHTQTSFVRITSNPAFSRDAVSPRQAAALLVANLSAARHTFWKEEDTPCELLDSDELVLQGHQQVGDAYLLALARKHSGRLATFDAGLASLVGPGRIPASHLEIVDI
ncbi:MAG TPA: TA system VapC family ribonuclease toxin [Thermoanaerobaculia bacterium]|nr:TA system VapC family ribonuclease toxin [Thermoanaerobaculia bacterium]